MQLVSPMQPKGICAGKEEKERTVAMRRSSSQVLSYTKTFTIKYE
jgi:hypothetical protein